ncbi:hypothetical protein ACFFLM_04425 [Deinococcus oregonensis]|uniref:Uncharacterized protein n=1 Tax=Deinococcus oregonensis TaxID=1805970 RepID=A0ABV6AUQ4_9DEIO
MTLSAPTFPLDLDDALQRLRDALGANYGAPTDGATLTRALGDDALLVEQAVHARPWATAARLIRENTEYEVNKGLEAQIDRKLAGLDTKQAQMDALAGILHLLPNTDEGLNWPPMGGVVETRPVF